jgi:hypothetical protein
MLVLGVLTRCPLYLFEQGTLASSATILKKDAAPIVNAAKSMIEKYEKTNLN